MHGPLFTEDNMLFMTETRHGLCRRAIKKGRGGGGGGWGSDWRIVLKGFPYLKINVH